MNTPAQFTTTGLNAIRKLSFTLDQNSGLRQSVDNIFVGNKPQTTMVFGDLVPSLTSIVEDGLRLTTDGSFTGNAEHGSAIGSASASDRLTLTADPATGSGAIALYSVDVAAPVGPHTIEFELTYINGVTRTVQKTFTFASGDPRSQTIEFPEANLYLKSVSWSIPDGVLVDNVVAISKIDRVLDFADLPDDQFNITSYSSSGFTLSSNLPIIGAFPPGSLAAFEFNRTNVDIVADNGGSFNVESLDIQFDRTTCGIECTNEACHSDRNDVKRLGIRTAS